MDKIVDYPSQIERNQDCYRYLLLDPLKPVSRVNPLHASRLRAFLGNDAVMVVQRADLAHSPQHCPLLVCLASPGRSVDPELLRTSVSYSRNEVGHDKRYVCGWLTSQQPTNIVANVLAERCSQSGQLIVDQQILPFFEPLRFELLHATKGVNEFIWPVMQWWFVSASGKLIYLEGQASEKKWQPDWGTLRNQQNIRDIQGVLFAWRRVCAVLPDNAGARAASAWANTVKYRLPHRQDRHYLALSELTLPVDITDHPFIQSLLQQAASSASLRFTQLMTSVPEDVWQALSSNTGGKYDA